MEQKHGGRVKIQYSSPLHAKTKKLPWSNKLSHTIHIISYNSSVGHHARFLILTILFWYFSEIG